MEWRVDTRMGFRKLSTKSDGFFLQGVAALSQAAALELSVARSAICPVSKSA
jgi:hypothetical protein